MKKRALLIVGLAMLIATAGVVYAHWENTLVANVNIATGTIRPVWSEHGTNDDGDNDGWDFEPARADQEYVYDVDGITSNDPSAAFVGGGGGNVVRIATTQLGIGDTGWFGNDCPSTNPYVVGGGITAQLHPVSFVLAKPSASLDGFTYPNFPHWKYTTPNPGTTQGIALHDYNDSLNNEVSFYIDCSNTPPVAATPRYPKDVADCVVTPGGGDTITVTIRNGYPSYRCTVKLDVTNTGSVPVRLQSITSTGNFGQDIEVAWSEDIFCGLQLHGSKTVDFYGSFHLLNSAARGGSYSQSYTLIWRNYNEYDGGACTLNGPTPS